MAAQKGHFRARHFGTVVAIPVVKEVSAKRHPRGKQKHPLKPSQIRGDLERHQPLFSKQSSLVTT